MYCGIFTPLWGHVWMYSSKVSISSIWVYSQTVCIRAHLWLEVTCASQSHILVYTGLLSPGSDLPACSIYNIFPVEPRFLNKRTRSRSLWAWLALAWAAKGTLREKTKWSLATTARSGCFCWGGCLGRMELLDSLVFHPLIIPGVPGVLFSEKM